MAVGKVMLEELGDERIVDVNRRLLAPFIHIDRCTTAASQLRT